MIFEQGKTMLAAVKEEEGRLVLEPVDLEELRELLAAPAQASQVVVDDDPLLTSKEAAQLLRCSPQTVYNWHSEGRLKPDGWKGRRCPLYRRSTLDRYVEGRDAS